MTSRRTSVSIRRASLGFAVVFGVIALVIVAALIWTSTMLHRSTETAIRDTQSMALANEVEVSLLSHQRISNIFFLRNEPEIGERRDELGAEMRRLIKEAKDLASDADEEALLDELDAEVQSYLASRQALEGEEALELIDVIQRIRPVVSQNLELLDELRELNARQVNEAYRRTEQVDTFADLAGAAAGIFILLGLLGLLATTRRFLLKPLLGLHESIVRFREGDMEARAPESGPQETLEIAKAFNEMASTLETQRDERLSFLAGVAHDLKNPLSGLKIGVRTLQRQDDPEKRERTLLLLERQVDRLARMIDDLLETTRIEAGQLDLEITSFDLREAIRDVVDLYRPTSPDHRLEVEAPEQPVMIEGDILRIEQVLGNLVNNAIKFSPDGGSIQVKLDATNAETTISITDDGIGIEPDELHQLFMPFRRMQPGVAPGTGLGLSVVRRIVEAHDGTIDVDSEPGIGSTFTVHLPLGEAADNHDADGRGVVAASVG